VVRDAINAGTIPGPRYLANGMEIARRDGELCAGITAYAGGTEEMREVIRNHIVKVGVDTVKLSMSGEQVYILARSY
jgi:N-acetylglucosamine-6-phosphate deacetylase